MDGATFFCTADRIGFDLEESETKNTGLKSLGKKELFCCL